MQRSAHIMRVVDWFLLDADWARAACWPTSPAAIPVSSGTAQSAAVLDVRLRQKGRGRLLSTANAHLKLRQRDLWCCRVSLCPALPAQPVLRIKSPAEQEAGSFCSRHCSGKGAQRGR